MPGGRMLPVGLFGHQIQYRQLASGAFGVVLQHRAPELVRILSGGARELIDEAFHHEWIVRVVDRTPESKAHAEILVQARDVKVGNLVVRIRHRLDEEGRATRPAEGRCRGADHLGFECNEFAGRIQPAAESDRSGRPVEVVLDVFLAAPDQLHRSAIGGFRSNHRLRHKIRLTSSTETATEILHMNLHASRRNAERGGGGRLRGLRILGPTPHLAAIVRDPRRAVHGLHAGVCQIRNLVGRLHTFRSAR